MIPSRPTRLSVLMLLTMAPACHRAAYRYQPLPAAAASATTADPAAPQLLFLSFRMSTAVDGTHQLEPLMIKATPGQASPVAEEEADGSSYLLLSQLDAANAPCGPARRVPHPLVQDVEAPAAPGTGAMERHLVRVPQAEFFVRLVRQPRAHAVRLEEVDPTAAHPISAVFSLPN